MTGDCWALVPVKTRGLCKSRLSDRLVAESRLTLVRSMLERCLAALRESRTINRIAVVSPERDTVPSDILVLADPGGGLNAALDAGRLALLEQGARELVVLPADLPLVTADDIDALVELGRRGGFALATDAAGTGTNALYVAPPTPFRFQFGPGSRFLHMQEAANVGLRAELLRTSGLELDVDGPSDLGELIARDDARYRALPLRTPDAAAVAGAPPNGGAASR
jgi:2-phospho-L-lactate guanylyltransferase